MVDYKVLNGQSNPKLNVKKLVKLKGIRRHESGTCFVECKQNRKLLDNLKIICQIRQIDFPKHYLFEMSEISLNSMLS